MIGDKATHANFSVDDLAAAREFYVEKLGFKLRKDRENDFVLVSGAGTKINVYFKSDHKAWDSTVLGIEVDDVADAVRELSEIGVEVEHLPGTNDLGIFSDPETGEAAWFKDPAGNWVCIGNFV